MSAIGVVALVAGVVPAAPLPAAGAAATSLTLHRKLEFTYQQFDRTSTHETFSGAAVGDITGDGVPEIVAGGPDGLVKAWRLDGTRFLEHHAGGGAVHSTPALVDLNRDGVLDVLVGSLSGHVIGIDAAGRRVFTARDRADMPIRGVFSTPTVGDLDRDGELEVVATSWDHNVHAWNLDGSYVPGFPVFVYDTLWSSPAVADLDGDGWLEIVFGGDMDDYPGAPYPKGGLVWVFRHDGTRQPGWPRTVPDQVVWSSPAVVDLSGDGKLDIVVGTGLNWPDPAGRKVYAFDRAGNALPGWPVSTGGRTMGSPAIGDLNGDGLLEVAWLADDGRVSVHDRRGTRLWSTCVISNRSGCRTDYGVHGQVTIADVDADGQQELVSAAEHWLRILDGRTGGEEDSEPMPDVWAPPAAPTVAAVNGEAWIVLNTTVNTVADGLPGTGDRQTVWVWRTGKTLGRADWPTFKQNSRRTGTWHDEIPPTASVHLSAAPPDATAVRVGWSGSDTGGSGLAHYRLDVREQGKAWATWVPRSTGTANTLYVEPGRTYDIRVRATDRALNVGAWSPVATLEVPLSAERVQPFSAAYTLASNGELGELSSTPLPNGTISVRLARDVALRADGRGGYWLDGWGGVHRFGDAPTVTTAGYWPGWDIARAIALNADGSGYKVDGWGGLHPIGAAKKISGPWWRGQDVVRDLALLPRSTAQDPAGYVLDAYGGVHAFGSAPPLAGGARRWSFRIGRGLALNPDGPGAWILDGWGGLHAVGGAARVVPTGYWQGWDIARGVVAATATSGYVLDGFGGVRGYGGAPKLHVGRYWGTDVGRSVALVR